MSCHWCVPAAVAALLAWSPALVATGAVAQPDDVASFYKGRQLTVAVASTPGGGYDSYARLVSRHIGKYIPGHPSVVVANMTGAGGHLVGRYIHGVAPRDGTWVAVVLPGTITGGLYVDRAKLQYDPSKLVQLGSANSEVDLCYVRSDSGLTSLTDVQQREVVVGGSAEGGATREQPAVLNNMLGTRFKVVSGYPGTREILLAVEKGEVTGVCAMSLAAMTLQRPQWLQDGFIRPISQNHAEGMPELTARGVMRATDLARSPADRRVLEFIYSQQLFGRPFVMADGVPAARAAAMRNAFSQAIRDPELLADAAKMRLEVNPTSGADLQVLLEKTYATPSDIVSRATEALTYKPPS
jgi:tripartite-type tricarboxylate transporter receptor subunit TctC